MEQVFDFELRNKRSLSDFRVPDQTDCSPQRPGTLSEDERAMLMMGDEGPACGRDD